MRRAAAGQHPDILMSDAIPRRALVTGGAHRIGRAIASDLAAHGHDVAIHANRSAEAASALADELAAAHGVATTVVTGDLSDPAAVRRLVPEAARAIGPLGILVNNASVFEEDDVGTVTEDSFRHHMTVNVEAPVLLTRAFADAGGPGLVVNILDQRVWKPTPRFLSYSASKAALWWLTRTMAQALAPRIRVVALGPGPTLKAARQSEEDFDALVAAVPLLAAPPLADFGRAVRFLAETGSITGQMIALDGGQHLAWETPDAVVRE